jgi:anti-anti-sigma factor
VKRPQSIGRRQKESQVEYRIETIGNATVVRLKGALDRSARGMTEMELLFLPRQGGNLVMDLAGVNYISSAGLHLLLDLHRRCEQLNGRLFLTTPTDAIRDIFAITGFASAGIKIFDTLEEGLSALRILKDKGHLRGDFAYEEAPAPPRPPTVGMETEGDWSPKTEEVHFSAFYPQEATVEKWHTLLVYTYIPTLLATVREDAQKFRDEIGEMRESRPATSTRLARGTDITVVPDCEGVNFNPKSVTFQWLEDLHRVQFRMQAEAGMAGLAGNARVTLYAGPLIVGTLKMGMLFSEAETGPGPVSSAEASARIYHQEDIFISYSHRDTDIVRICEKAYKALGHNVLVDYETLRSGQNWNAELMRMIDRADVFQLFWSENASKSEYCRQEWQYALGLKRGEGFIRPVYWQEPIPTPPSELSAIHFDFAPFTIQG